MAAELRPQQHAGGEQSSGKTGREHSEGVLPPRSLGTRRRASAGPRPSELEGPPGGSQGRGHTRSEADFAKGGQPLACDGGWGSRKWPETTQGRRGGRSARRRGRDWLQVTGRAGRAACGAFAPPPRGSPVAEGAGDTHTPAPGLGSDTESPSPALLLCKAG